MIQGVPKNMEFSDEFDIVLLWISIVIPNFKSHTIIMPARVYFMKTVNGCKDVPIMAPQDEQWRRRTSLLCLYTEFLCGQNINKQIANIADENLTEYSFLSRYHYIKSKNYWKDDIEFVTELPCLLRHPVSEKKNWLKRLFHIYSCFKQQKLKIRKNENERNKKMDSSMLVCNLCKFLSVICKISGLFKKKFFFSKLKNFISSRSYAKVNCLTMMQQIWDLRIFHETAIKNFVYNIKFLIFYFIFPFLSCLLSLS